MKEETWEPADASGLTGFEGKVTEAIVKQRRDAEKSGPTNDELSQPEPEKTTEPVKTTDPEKTKPEPEPAESGYVSARDGAPNRGQSSPVEIVEQPHEYVLADDPEKHVIKTTSTQFV